MSQKLQWNLARQYKSSQEAEAAGGVDEGAVMDDDILDADFEDLDGDKHG